jgi:hypothetical protein
LLLSSSLFKNLVTLSWLIAPFSISDKPVDAAYLF